MGSRRGAGLGGHMGDPGPCDVRWQTSKTNSNITALCFHIFAFAKAETLDSDFAVRRYLGFIQYYSALCTLARIGVVL